ncbi:MAG: hypothetical protein HQM09_21955 [Candidatus Riflebacteria bacterium]|nr:hypothetical protein [Candidatus Riflebacteria bacterium]
MLFVDSITDDEAAQYAMMPDTTAEGYLAIGNPINLAKRESARVMWRMGHSTKEIQEIYLLNPLTCVFSGPSMSYSATGFKTANRGSRAPYANTSRAELESHNLV